MYVIQWRRKWQTTPVFLLGKSHGQRNLGGYSPWGHKRVTHNLETKTSTNKPNDIYEREIYILYIYMIYISHIYHIYIYQKKTGKNEVK